MALCIKCGKNYGQLVENITYAGLPIFYDCDEVVIMPKSINEMHQVPLNPFEALKRFYVSRGYIPRYFRRSAQFEAEQAASPSEKSAIQSESKIEESLKKKVEEELKKSEQEKKIEEKAKQIAKELSKSQSKKEKPVDPVSKIKQKEEEQKAKEAAERTRLRRDAQREEPSDGYEMTESQSKLEEKKEKDRAKQEVEQSTKREMESETEKVESGVKPSDEIISQVRAQEDKKQAQNEENQMQMDKKFDENPMLATLDEGSEPSRRAKKEAAQAIVSEEKINDVKHSTEDILYEAETVFPFTLFPDTLKLDREKLTLCRRDFFRTAQISSVPLSEIMSVEANVGPFFGSIHFIFRFFNDNEKTFTFLKRQDAINLQRLVHGFIIAHRKGVDISKVPTKELRDTLVQIGQGVSD